MDHATASLLAASTAFVGGHFVMSHPLRAGLIRALGEKGFMGVYSLVSLGTFAWMIVALRAVPRDGALLWNGQGDVAWVAASALTLVALVLLAGSFRGNPALPETPVEKIAAAAPVGVFAVTRHPMMWGIALWAIAHILVMPTPRMVIFAGAFIVLALVGAHLQDRKKQALLGAAWAGWEAKTSYWPRLAGLVQVGVAIWVVGLLVWLAVTWGHGWLGAMPAGPWRWL